MKKLLTMMLVFALLFTACNNPTPPQEEDPIKTFSFTDSVGREVELPENIERIAASGQLSQMYLFPLCPELLIGIANPWVEESLIYVPEEYRELPVLGQFYGTGTMNMEEVIKAAPQVIIDVGEAEKSMGKDMDEIMEQVNIPTIHIEASSSLSPEAFRTLGKLLKREEKAEELAVFIEETLNLVETTIQGREKKDVLYLLGNKGLQTLAETSFHAEALDLVANNVAVVEQVSFKGSGNEIDFEQILLWQPEVLFFAPDSIYEQIATDQTWQNLAAVKNGNYHYVPGLPYNWVTNPPSVNMYLGLLWLTDLLYPEQENFDFSSKAQEYYKIFYDYDLSLDELAALLNP